MTVKTKLAIFAVTLVLVAFVLWRSGLFDRKPPSPEEMKSVAMAQAQKLLDAMSSRDFQSWADLTIPAAIDQSGGRDKWIESMKVLLQTNDDVGAKMDSVKAEQCTGIAERESTHYAAITYEFELTIGNITRAQKSVLLAVSKDGGRNWKFAEGSYNRNRFAALVPNFPNEIPLPKREDLEPRIIREVPIGRKRPKAIAKPETKPLADEELNVRLKTQAQEMFDAMVKGDLKVWEDRTLPEAIEKLGGREKWLKSMEGHLKIRHKVGITVDKITAREVVATRSCNPECYGVIAYELATTFEGKQNIRNGSLIGASADGGRNWTFIVGGGFAVGSGSGLTRFANMSELIPDWPKDLTIPD
jgi:hypothetical protein